MEKNPQAYVDLELTNQKLKELDSQLEHVEMKLEQSVLAKNMITALTKASEGDELLIPVGAGTFITVKAGDISQIKQAIGAGLVVEKSSDETLKLLEEQQKTLLANQEALSKQYEETVEKAITLQTQIENSQQNN
ncbi:prefoldin subunit alpha [Candidatus Woesearchaeota archaeon]|nr:prefoldin subunit alpha [Candidatus Woesearchaeota archaeon]